MEWNSFPIKSAGISDLTMHVSLLSEVSILEGEYNRNGILGIGT